MLFEKALLTSAALCTFIHSALSAPTLDQAEGNTQALLITQYQRKDPSASDDSGKYWIAASQNSYRLGDLTNDGAIAAKNDHIEFNYQGHKVTITTPRLNGGSEPKNPDDAPLTIEGWMDEGDEFRTDSAQCKADDWQDMDTLDAPYTVEFPIGLRKKMYTCQPPNGEGT